MTDPGESSTRATRRAVEPATVSSSSRRAAPIPGKPFEHFEMEEATVLTSRVEVETSGTGAEAVAEVEPEVDETVYPSGPKLWLNTAAMLLSCFLRGLDLTVVSVAVPSIANEFKTIRDIGWYTAVNGIVLSSTCFFFGKVYSVFDVKRSYLLSIVVFWLGSITCTFAPTSKMFIFGRALISLGAAWQGGGVMTQFNTTFPLHKRPLVISALMFTQTIAMVASPVIGGALIRRCSWRACFGINIPLNFLSLVFTAYGMQTTTGNPDVNLPLREKFKRLDVTGTLIVVPAITCLLIGLQWGGTRYGWHDGRIITLLVVATVLLGAFAYLQHKLQDKAVLPPRILKRSVLAGAWFTACCDGVLATTESYMSIYFQGVRGLSPLRSGVLFVPMIVGLALATLVSGPGVQRLGYYSPFMLFTSAVAPVASGLLTTIDLDSQLRTAAGLLGLLGFSIGLGMQGPIMAVSASLEPKDVAIGSAVLAFGGGVGSAVFASSAAALFQNRLGVEVAKHSLGVNVTNVETAGLSDIRDSIGRERLRQVLTGYDKATVQTLYIPLGLTVASVVGSALTEWRSVKKKTS